MAAIAVVKQSLGSWSHIWSLSNVSGCGSTSLFGSRAGTHQIRDQSSALEDRNDSNNSLEVYTPNSFIHLFYNSPYMDVVDMHNILILSFRRKQWKTMSYQKVAGGQSLVFLLSPLTGTLHTGSNMTSACMVRVGRINFHIPDS